MSPGAIGRAQLQRSTALVGYFQPVEIMASEGTMISLAVDGRFSDPQPAPFKAGLLVAPVYRLRIFNHPLYPDRELYPTIEVIDRLYPPPGYAVRFPIPIELNDEDIRLALEGNFITRVVYLEDPETALPVVQSPTSPNWFDVGPGVDPLEEADRQGRPLAILRMGGRQPDLRAPFDAEFLGGCAPWVYYPPALPPGVVYESYDPAPQQQSIPPQQGGQPGLQPTPAPAVPAQPILPQDPMARRWGLIPWGGR